MDSDWSTSSLLLLEDLFPATLDLSWSDASTTLPEVAIERTIVPAHPIEEVVYEPVKNGRGRERVNDREDEDHAIEEDDVDGNQYHAHPSQLKRSRNVGTMLDITDLLCLLQSEAALTVGMTASTFCKRWKEAVGERKWPFRLIIKLDKEIASLQRKTPESRAAKTKIAALRKQRIQLVAPTSIRVS
jgi:hypothetical protein